MYDDVLPVVLAIGDEIALGDESNVPEGLCGRGSTDQRAGDGIVLARLVEQDRHVEAERDFLPDADASDEIRRKLVRNEVGDRRTMDVAEHDGTKAVDKPRRAIPDARSLRRRGLEVKRSIGGDGRLKAARVEGGELGIRRPRERERPS
jgi:hypothetical protein